MRRISLVFVMLAGLSFSAIAQGQSDFYKGKTITLVTGTAGNGNYDLIARVVAEFLPRYLPGGPNAIVQSMPDRKSVV